MNQIIDISDISQGSHLDLFSPLQQQQIIQKLSSPKIQTRSTYDATTFENVIEKVKKKVQFVSRSFD